MRNHRALWPCGLAMGLALGAAGHSLAEEPAQPVAAAMATLHWTDAPAQAPAIEATAVVAATEVAPAEPAAAPVEVSSDAALDDIAGRGTDTDIAVALTEQSLSAVNTGNTLNAGTIASGAITLQDSALSGFSGISNVMMNTGHNNNLQSNMSVTVIITP